MKGIPFIGWMASMQRVGQDRSLGEFSEAEIAARQGPVVRTSLLFGLATALLAAFDRTLAERKAPGRVPRLRRV